MSFNIEATAPPKESDLEGLFMPSGEDDPRPKLDDKPTKLCAEPGCSNPSALTPTGRQGKFCEEHKKSHSAGTKTKPSASRAKWPQAPEVENALNTLTNFLTIGVAALADSTQSEALGKDALTLQAGMPRVNRELVNVARDDPTLQKYLNWLASPGKYGALTMASLAVVVPILSHHGLIPTLPALFGAGSANDNERSNG